jgi:hypothetical protein
MADQLAYRLEEAAELAAVSLRTLRRAIDRGDLTPSYLSDHPVIDADELRAWIKRAPSVRPTSLPTERAVG